MRFPKFEIFGLIVVCCARGMPYASSWYFWSTGDLVEYRDWPTELVELVNDLAKEGDEITEVEVRSATEKWLNLHKRELYLTPVGLNGIERKRVLEEWPRAWSRPTSACELCANPVGLPGAEDGEFEFILLHDKGTATLHFYYYFNF